MILRVRCCNFQTELASDRRVPLFDSSFCHDFRPAGNYNSLLEGIGKIMRDMEIVLAHSDHELSCSALV
jgi:hypothetical protein